MPSVEELMNHPLTGSEVTEALGGKTKIVVYSDLKQYKNIDQLLSPYGNAIILLRTTENSGHWVCLKRTGRTITFFDSYGYFPDDQKAIIGKKTNERYRQAYNHICFLMHQATDKYVTEYNEHKYQDIRADTATCGIWCILFILSDLNSDGFWQSMNSFHGHKPNDELATRIFYDRL